MATQEDWLARFAAKGAVVRRLAAEGPQPSSATGLAAVERQRAARAKQTRESGQENLFERQGSLADAWQRKIAGASGKTLTPSHPMATGRDMQTEQQAFEQRMADQQTQREREAAERAARGEIGTIGEMIQAQMAGREIPPETWKKLSPHLHDWEPSVGHDGYTAANRAEYLGAYQTLAARSRAARKPPPPIDQIAMDLSGELSHMEERYQDLVDRDRLSAAYKLSPRIEELKAQLKAHMGAK